VSVVLLSVLSASYLHGRNRAETERQHGLVSPSAPELIADPEDPPPDYKTIFPAAAADQEAEV